MSKYLLIWTIALAIVMMLISSPFSEASQIEEISQQVAAVTGIAETIVITDYNISLRTDFDSNALHLLVICTLRNKSSEAIEKVDFDIFAREKFYRLKVNINSVSQLVTGKFIPQQFSHSCEPKPEEPSLEGSMKFPKITRVKLSPILEKEGESRLQFDYSFTQIDPHKKDLPVRILAALPNGSKELCLISDFSWLPQVAWDFEKMMGLFSRNFFPKLPNPTWKISITHPLNYESMVIDGKLEEIEEAGKDKISRWRWCAGGLPQILIGQLDKVEVKGKGISAVFLLPKGGYQRHIVEAVGNFLIRAYRFYCDLYGPLNGKDIHIAVSSGGMGGHGAFLGMTVDAVGFLPRIDKKEFSPSKFFNHPESWSADGFARICAHELAHSWWGLSVISYGRGTKFLRESFCEFSTMHLARKLYGIDRFRELTVSFFMAGAAKYKLFLPVSDRSRLAYGKGALVLDMLRVEMGDDMFFRCLRHFATKYKNSYATFIDFVSVCNEISQRDWMPFFNHWCYGKGYPIYRLVNFKSTLDKEGWKTSVTIRNDGKGIVRCPLELRMGKEALQESFRVPEGEEATFTYQTDAQVDEVIIDPNHTAYQGDEKEALLKVLAVKEPPCEWRHYKKGIAYAEIGENEKAIEYLNRAYANHRSYIGPGYAHPAIYFSRGIAYLHMGEKKRSHKDLCAFIDRVLEIASDNPGFLIGTLAYAGVITGSEQERQSQLNRILKTITGEDIPFDEKLDKWRKWWQANRASFQVSPSASILSPKGIKK